MRKLVGVPAMERMKLLRMGSVSCPARRVSKSPSYPIKPANVTMNEGTRRAGKKNPLAKPFSAGASKEPKRPTRAEVHMRSEGTAITTEQSTLTEAIER